MPGYTISIVQHVMRYHVSLEPRSGTLTSYSSFESAGISGSVQIPLPDRYDRLIAPRTDHTDNRDFDVC